MKAVLKLPTRYFLAAIGGAAALAIGLGHAWFAGDVALATQRVAQGRGARFIGYERGGHVWVGHHRAILDELASFLVSRTENPA